MSTLPAAGPARLIARTVEIPEAVAADLLTLIPAATPASQVCSWVRHGEGLVGWGSALDFATRGSDRFAQAAGWWREGWIAFRRMPA